MALHFVRFSLSSTNLLYSVCNWQQNAYVILVIKGTLHSDFVYIRGIFVYFERVIKYKSYQKCWIRLLLFLWEITLLSNKRSAKLYYCEQFFLSISLKKILIILRPVIKQNLVIYITMYYQTYKQILVSFFICGILPKQYIQYIHTFYLILYLN